MDTYPYRYRFYQDGELVKDEMVEAGDFDPTLTLGCALKVADTFFPGQPLKVHIENGNCEYILESHHYYNKEIKTP